jgi:hypothetical protein
MNLDFLHLPADKRLHLIGGVLFAAGAVVALTIAHFWGPGYAIAAASIGMGYGVERYQAIRNEGAPSNLDWAASSLAGVLVGSVVELYRVLQ